MKKNIFHTLTDLARRVNKNNILWYSKFKIDDHTLKFTCLICGEQMIQSFICLNTSYEKIDDHGMKHLKNNNLLAFI